MAVIRNRERSQEDRTAMISETTKLKIRAMKRNREGFHVDRAVVIRNKDRSHEDRAVMRRNRERFHLDSS